MAAVRLFCWHPACGREQENAIAASEMSDVTRVMVPGIMHGFKKMPVDRGESVMCKTDYHKPTISQIQK